MNESAKTRKLCRELEKIGAITLPYVGSARQIAGWPDRWIAHPLWTGWVEFKDGEGRLSKLQQHRLREIWLRDPGGAFVAWHDTGTIGLPDGVHEYYTWDGSARGLLEVLHSAREYAHTNMAPDFSPPEPVVGPLPMIDGRQPVIRHTMYYGRNDEPQGYYITDSGIVYELRVDGIWHRGFDQHGNVWPSKSAATQFIHDLARGVK